jgi:hypothetical protein
MYDLFRLSREVSSTLIVCRSLTRGGIDKGDYWMDEDLQMLIYLS